MALNGPAVLLIAIAPVGHAEPFLVASAALAGFSGLVYNINQVSFRQAITPERMQGRMNATMRFLVWGTIPIGSIISGILATILGLSATIWIGAILSFTPVLFLIFSPILDDHDDAQQPRGLDRPERGARRRGRAELGPPPKL